MVLFGYYQRYSDMLKRTKLLLIISATLMGLFTGYLKSVVLGGGKPEYYLIASLIALALMLLIIIFLIRT